MNGRFLERYNGLKLGWLRDSVFLILMIAAIFVLFRLVIGVSVVGGESMDPTLTDGDIVVYSRLSPAYKRGDVVSVRVPSGDYYIKRIVAEGGDDVDISDGKLVINGAEAEDTHAAGKTEEETGAVIYPYRVRDGNYFVLGDNREVSMDSRMFGEISRRQIKGKIVLRIGKGGIQSL